MAEAVFSDIVNRKNLESRFKVDSGGLIGYHAGKEFSKNQIKFGLC